MQPQMKYNRQASLKVTRALSWENNFTLKPEIVCRIGAVNRIKAFAAQICVQHFPASAGLNGKHLICSFVRVELESF